MCYANIFIVFTILFLCIVGVSLIFGGAGGAEVPRGVGSGGDKSMDDTYVESIKVLYRQCGRWASASLQDESDIIKTLHANYATGYLWALKDIVSTDDFKKITGEDFLAFEKTIVQVQDAATKSLISKCKDLVYVEDPVLLKAIYSR